MFLLSCIYVCISIKMRYCFPVKFSFTLIRMLYFSTCELFVLTCGVFTIFFCWLCMVRLLLRQCCTHFLRIACKKRMMKMSLKGLQWKIRNKTKWKHPIAVTRLINHYVRLFFVCGQILSTAARSANAQNRNNLSNRPFIR